MSHFGDVKLASCRDCFRVEAFLKHVCVRAPVMSWPDFVIALAFQMLVAMFMNGFYAMKIALT